MDLRTQFEESENPMLRASRAVTSKVSDLFGGLFEATEMSQVHTEICKVDPSFNIGHFKKTCETLFIPTILESIIRPDLEVLKDWTYEGAYNVLAAPIKAGLERKVTFASKVLDIENVDIAMGKMMEQVSHHMEVIPANFIVSPHTGVSNIGSGNRRAIAAMKKSLRV